MKFMQQRFFHFIFFCIIYFFPCRSHCIIVVNTLFILFFSAQVDLRSSGKDATLLTFTFECICSDEFSFLSNFMFSISLSLSLFFCVCVCVSHTVSFYSFPSFCLSQWFFVTLLVYMVEEDPASTACWVVCCTRQFFEM